MKKESFKGLVCIGAPKCGTTLLYKQIVKDNQFNNPLEKELDFWNCKKNVLDSNSPYLRKLPRTLQKIFKDFNQNDFFNFYKTRDFSKAFLDFSIPGTIEIQITDLIEKTSKILRPKIEGLSNELIINIFCKLEKLTYQNVDDDIIFWILDLEA